MERDRNGYVSPLSTRYASKAMQYLFSENNKFRTWRRLWIALATAERERGLSELSAQRAAEYYAADRRAVEIVGGFLDDIMVRG